jgi:hypothetical protein
VPTSPPSRTDAELRQLRAEIQALKQLVTDSRLQTQLVHLHLRRMTSLPVRHGWLKYVVKDLETNPKTQYKVHLYGAVYWLVNFPLITLLFFTEPALWLKLGIFITLIYSIYANFSTDYGAMSSAMAASGMQLPPEIPLEQVQAKNNPEASGG